MDDVLSTYGNNDYKIRHMGKEAMLRGGILPMSLVPSTSALEIFHMMEGEVGENDCDIVENDGTVA